MTEPHARLHVHIAGLVQGVGFRHATYRHATKLGLTGWVRNLPDGRVEAVCEGPRPVLDNMLQWCRTGPALSRVDTIESRFEPATGAFDAFDIAF